MPNEQQPQTYAQALVEQATEGWMAPLKQVAAVLASGDFGSLDDPALPFSKKQAIIAGLVPVGGAPQVTNFLFLLASRNEMHLLPQVIDEFDHYAQRGSSRPIAQVTSAVPLTDSEKVALEERLLPRFGDELDMSYGIDPAILGGVVIRVGDKVIDGSVAGKLAALRDTLK